MGRRQSDKSRKMPSTEKWEFPNKRAQRVGKTSDKNELRGHHHTGCSEFHRKSSKFQRRKQSHKKPSTVTLGDGRGKWVGGQSKALLDTRALTALPPCISSWDLLEEMLHRSERAKNVEREKTWVPGKGGPKAEGATRAPGRFHPAGRRPGRDLFKMRLIRNWISTDKIKD